MWIGIRKLRIVIRKLVPWMEELERLDIEIEFRTNLSIFGGGT